MKAGEIGAIAGKALNLIPKDVFDKIHSLISKWVEGGYYHPDMKKKMKPSDQKKMGNSGETHLGLDREQGSKLAMYPEWAAFWQMIDADRAKNPIAWRHYYMGGSLYPALHDLAGKIMYQWFNRLLRRYVSLSSYDEIIADKRLQAHMIYAAWNGEEWFKRFAKALNNAAIKFEGDKEKIFTTAFAARKNSSNSLIRQQAGNFGPVFKAL